MKTLYLLMVFTLSFIMSFGQDNKLMKDFDSTIKRHYEIDTTSKGKLLSPVSFRKLSQRSYSRVSSNATIQNQPGSYASLKLTNDNTVADLQTSFFISDYTSITIGFNAVVSENIADLYSGKDGLNTDWGVKFGLNKRIQSSIFYTKEQEGKLRAKRKALLYELLNKYQFLLNEDYGKLKSKKEELDLQREKRAGSAKEFATLADTYAELAYKLETLDSFYKSNQVDQGKIEAFINNKISTLELEQASVNGYSSWVFNLNGFYNRKGFTQFFPSVLPVNSRFTDTAANNYGINAGISYFRTGVKLYHNFNVSLGFENKSNFELSENQKYNRTYTTQTQIPNTPAGLSQYYSKSKKAFDSSSLTFKTFASIDLKLQYTLLFGKLKAFGFNTFVNCSNSKFYSVSNKIDIGFGPVISLVDKSDTSSKLNFSLFGSLQNLFDNSLTTKEKFVVSFNVNVPFTILK